MIGCPHNSERDSALAGEGGKHRASRNARRAKHGTSHRPPHFASKRSPLRAECPDAVVRHPEVLGAPAPSLEGRRPRCRGRILRGPRSLSSGRPLRAGPVGGHLRMTGSIPRSRGAIAPEFCQTANDSGRLCVERKRRSNPERRFRTGLLRLRSQ